MKRVLFVLAIGIFGAWTLAAQTISSNQATASAQSQTSVETNTSGGETSIHIPGGIKIDATLATSLDAKRSRPGDDVEVRTEEDIKEDGKVILKKGAHLVGHVTQAQVLVGGKAPSQLGIVFDHIQLKDGQEVPFSASILAMASAQPAAGITGTGDMMASGNGMTVTRGPARENNVLVGAVATAASATSGTVMTTASSTPLNTVTTTNTATRSSGAVGGLTAAGRLAPNSSGVFGLEGLSIDSSATSATQGSVIVSSTKSVHLDSGTQLLLRTAGEAQ